MLAHSVRSTRLQDALAVSPGMPRISVVLLISPATLAPAARVSAAVTACRDHGAELLVAWSGARTVLRTLESAFPAVRFVTEDGEDVDLRALRTRACQLATGNLVSVVQEMQPIDECWFARHVRGGARFGREEGSA